jgi:hypothetical protein
VRARRDLEVDLVTSFSYSGEDGERQCVLPVNVKGYILIALQELLIRAELG